MFCPFVIADKGIFPTTPARYSSGTSDHVLLITHLCPGIQRVITDGMFSELANRGNMFPETLVARTWLRNFVF